MLLLQLFCKAHLDLRINLPLVHMATVLHHVLQQLPRAGRAQHRRVLLLLEGARFVANGDAVPVGEGKVSPGGCWPSGRAPWQGVPVDLLFHVGGVAAAVVGEQQPPVVEAVHVDLDVSAVHDDHVGGQRLAGDLWAGDSLSGTPKQSEQRGWELEGTSSCSVLRLLPHEGAVLGRKEAQPQAAPRSCSTLPRAGLTHNPQLV